MSDAVQPWGAASAVPAEILFALILTVTDETPTQSEPLMEGRRTDVYRVSTRANTRWIVRVQDEDRTTFFAEAWALERCRAAGVPVPEVHLLTSMSILGRQKAVMVQREMPGRTVREIMGQMTPGEAAQVWTQAGTLLRRIHSIPAEGYGALVEPPEHWAWSSRADWFVAARTRLAAHGSLLQGWGLSVDDLHTLGTMLDIYESEFSCDQPVLCHGDFLPKHLFVDGALRLSGIIDFGDVQGGPPIHDLAYLQMWRPEVDLEWLRVGYGPMPMLDDDFARRLVLHTVGVELQVLDALLRGRGLAAAVPFAARLRRTLRQWRTMRKAAGKPSTEPHTRPPPT